MTETQHRWQAEQATYPSEIDYRGESSCIFELEAAVEEITGELNAGDVFMYLFRRFGYPKFGWDDQKQLVLYRITTPMPGVILMVEPGITGAYTFADIMRKDIAEKYEAEDNKPFTERYERFEAWMIAEKGTETMHIYLEPDNEKLQRVWQTWAAVNKDRDFEDREEAQKAFIDEQARIAQALLEEYAEIEPYARPIPLADRPDDSIMKQVHNALCDAIRDLLRPVYVRDVMINVAGEVMWSETLNQDKDSVEYAASCGVGDSVELMRFFYAAHDYVVDAGYECEIYWCDQIWFENIDIDDFYREYVWAVLNAGMREQAARSIFNKYMDTGDTNVIRHDGKRKAIEHVLDNCKMYYDQLLSSDNKIEWFVTLPWIGHITKHHIARNLGIDTVKPDRHLVRLAERFGYETPLKMCEAIQKETSGRLGVIDVILWRYCNLRLDYNSQQDEGHTPPLTSYFGGDQNDTKNHIRLRNRDKRPASQIAAPQRNNDPGRDREHRKEALISSQ